MGTSVKSLEKAVVQNKNNEFYKCLNQIVLVYNSKNSVIKQYIKDKSELVKAKKKLDTATQEKDAAKIEEAQKAVDKAKKELNASKKLIYNFFGDENINDLYKLQESLRQCTQYMSGISFGTEADKAERNPFMINFNSKKAGASAGTPIDSIIEECIKDNTFESDDSERCGGAIFLGQLRSTNHYFRNMTIENNKCGKEGGGVFADAWGCNTADIKLFGWNKIRYNTDVCGAASNAKMIKDTCRTVFKIMGDFDTYNSDIRGTTNSDGSCMVFLNTSSDYVNYYSYGKQSGAFRADNGRLERSGSGVYWYK